jgi:16S rRNA (cytidine1402-2'-O)-methyltransferase
MSGILYVVATPIGNLEDVTLRALRVLREVSVIAAEDTRRTARLLQHYSIHTPTTSLHEHNERTRTPALVERLKKGQSVALVSDAGTPALSDPGALLVRTAHEQGIKVEPIPGPSAVAAIVSAAGLGSDGFLFAGFPPSRSNARKKWLGAFAREGRPLVIFEAPHRIRELLTDLREVLGDRVVTMGRELTKTHEELVIKPISAHLEGLSVPRGEFALVVHPGTAVRNNEDPLPSGVQLLNEFGELTNSQRLNRREALRSLAERYQVPSRRLYRILEEAKLIGRKT